MKGHDPVVKRLILDVLKPLEPPINEFAVKLASLHGVDHVNVSLAEIDQSTESVKVSLEGSEISIEAVKRRIEELGAVVHSIDEVLVGKKPQVK